MSLASLQLVLGTNMDIDLKKLMDELARDSPPKIKTSLSISEDVWKDFQKLCEPYPASVVLEKVIMKLLEQAKSKSK